MKIDVSEVVRFKQEPWEEGDSVLVLKRLSRKKRNELTSEARQRYIDTAIVSVMGAADRIENLPQSVRDDLITKALDRLERAAFSVDIAWLGDAVMREQLIGFENVNAGGEPLDPENPDHLELVRGNLPDEILEEVGRFMTDIERPRAAAERAQKVRAEAEKKTSASGSPGEPPESSPDAEKSATTSSDEDAA